MPIVGRAGDAVRTRLQRRRNARFRADGGLATLRPPRSFVFVCYGNINRSALAERHLRQLVGDSLEINSCGLHDAVGRPADPQMVAVARERGVSLADWSSRGLTSELIDESDLVLAMESWHLVRVLRRFPAARDRSWLLGACFDDPSLPLEIADPFGQPRAEYERCFDVVTRATRLISSIVEDPSQVSPPLP